MQLYSFFNSSTSYRVRIALALKNIDYKYIGINIRVEEQSEENYTKINPSKSVPMLVDNSGVSLSQSMAIIQYLDDLQISPRLIPEEIVLKARVLELSNIIACDMHPVNNLRILNYLNRELGISEAEKKLWYEHWVTEGFTAVEELLGRYGYGQYCFGDKPTFADCCLVPQVANALRMGCDLSSFTRIMSVYKHCLKQPSFKLAAPENQPDYIS